MFSLGQLLPRDATRSRTSVDPLKTYHSCLEIREPTAVFEAVTFDPFRVEELPTASSRGLREYAHPRLFHPRLSAFLVSWKILYSYEPPEAAWGRAMTAVCLETTCQLPARRSQTSVTRNCWLISMPSLWPLTVRR